MKKVPKETTDQALIDAFLAKGGTIKKGDTKPMRDDLGLSKGTWGMKLTKEEKEARNGPIETKKKAD